jgi:hyperosmotically inducible protein
MTSFRKTNLVIFLTIIAAITFNHSIASAGAIEDSALTIEVKAKLVSESDIPKTISVTTNDGVVSLKGSVDTDLQAHRAVEVASSVEGVIDVVDAELKVKGSKSLLSDAIITAKVKGKIRRLFVNKQIAAGYDLHVETTDQIVHIFGKVARSADIDTVVAIAKEVKEVKSVKTSITVNP